MTQQTGYWTNPSVLEFAGSSDPVDFVTQKARDMVLKAMQSGWQGPPYNPFTLAEILEIPTIPRDDVLDARILAAGSRRIQIEFNPNRSRGRQHFSVAHEIAHTLFPDYVEYVRNRGQSVELEADNWQLELLCNIAAAELTMPVGSELDINTTVTIDNVLRLQKQFDVSTEAISIRLAKITLSPCTIFAAARFSDDESITDYRLDYSVRSRTSPVDLIKGQELQDSILSQCTAVGYTAKGIQKDLGKYKELYLECVGIPSYPGNHYPRVIGIAQRMNDQGVLGSNVRHLRGDALEPRSDGINIIAHIVNDKTPNWGAGFGRAIKSKYPSVQKEFREWAELHSNEFSLGNTHISNISDDLSVVHMIAQHGYGQSAKPRIRYSALRDCLYKLNEFALTKGASVHMPRIGTGYAGGNWPFILELIDEALTRNGIDVTVYTVPDYEPRTTQSMMSLGSSVQARI